MKTGLIFLAILLFFTFFQACSKKTEQEVKKNIDTASQKLGHELDTLVNKLSTKDTLFDNAKVVKVDNSKLPAGDFRKRLNDVFDHYNDIKDNLANDDSSGVSKHATELKKALANVQKDTASQKLGSKWKTWVSSVEKTATELETTKSLEKQRNAFSVLSSSMEEMVKNFGIYNETIYKMKCATMPGKTWLTDTKKINNPYSGKEKANGKSGQCAQVVEAWEFD